MSVEVFINHMPDSGISVEEQMAGSIPAEQPKVEQPEIKLSNGHSNGASELQESIVALNERIRASEEKVSPEVIEKQKELARAFGKMGLTDAAYDDFVRRGRQGACYINGDRSMEDARANVRSMFLGGEASQKTKLKSEAKDSANGKDTTSGNNGVHS